MRVRTVAILVELLVGCGEPTPDTAVRPPPSPGAIADAIKNGIATAHGFDEVVRLTWTPAVCTDCSGNPQPAGTRCQSSCSGTLLRNDVVLTARHCVQDDDGKTVRLLEPGALHVDNSAVGGAATTAREILPHPDPGVDVALIFLSRPLPVQGSSIGHARPIYPFDPTDEVGQELWVAGYGLEEGAACGTVDGRLRLGLVRLTDADNAPLPGEGRQPLKWSSGSRGQVQHKGDSGSAVFSLRSQPMAALGVLDTCEFILSLHLGTCYSASPRDYRVWADQHIARRTTSIRDTFSVDPGSAYEAVEPDEMCSGKPRWAFSSVRRAMTETTNAVPCGSSPGGPLWLRREAFQDAFLGVRVDTTAPRADDDTVGLVFRYVDAGHYYQVSFDDDADVVTFWKRNADEWTQLGPRHPVEVDWNARPSLSVYALGYSFYAYYDGAFVGSAMDTEYPVGRVGVMKRLQEDLVVDDFEVRPFDVADEAYWPPP